jgi:hypothetical protein
MNNAIEPTQPAPLATRRAIPPAPIHPLAALTTIVLDNVFGWLEIIDPLALILTSLAIGTISFLTTMFVQRYLAKDEWGASVAKGMVMGVLAGVPYQVTGTAIGVPLLAWAGAHQWIKLPQKAKPEQLSSPEQIIDAEVRQVVDQPSVSENQDQV